MPEAGPEEKPFSYHPDHKRIGADPDVAVINGACHLIEGVHYCHVGKVVLATLTEDAALVFVGLSHGRNGLYQAYTPEGARYIANTLLRMAEDCERANTENANALLAATLAKGQPEGPDGETEGRPA